MADECILFNMPEKRNRVDVQTKTGKKAGP